MYVKFQWYLVLPKKPNQLDLSLVCIAVNMQKDVTELSSASSWGLDE